MFSSFRLQGITFHLSFALSLFMATTCPAQVGTPPQSTFFSTAAEEAFSTYQLSGDGDLWPSCWADDDKLYAANGDGTAFTGGGQARFDMAVSSISGTPPNLSGTTIATNVGTNYSGPNYNRKPTGMLCINNTLYLAFQNLHTATFDDAPAASIAQSTDHGVTWIWDTTAPMFGVPGNPNDPKAYRFTTIFFLDYGKNAANAIDGYVYAYGLDYNWRSQEFLYLARVPNSNIMNRSTWEFYTGTDTSGSPIWSSDITKKTAVLTDDRLLYPIMFGTDCPTSQAVIGQGGVVYDAPLQRYIFSSWSCTTHELYEAPHPWGPWSHFLSNDFGPLRTTLNYGQYGTSIPSKFISSDGKTLYLQSNVFVNAYTFSLRKIFLQTYTAASPANALSNTNLALTSGTRAISKSTHFGSLCGLNCSDQLSNGILTNNEDDFDEESKTTDWWGYTWPQPYNINKVTYTTGTVFPNGGWYASGLHIQVRNNFQWTDVAGASITPAYPYSNAAGAQTTYTFTFPNTSGDGVRIIGTPGGTGYFTSIAQLGVYYANTSISSSTTTSLSVAPNPAPVGQSVTFTAQVTSSGSGTPTGTVTFLNGTAQSGTGSLDGTGKAAYSTSALVAGSYSITAVYGGDTNFAGSTSAAAALTIGAAPPPPDFTVAANPTSLSVAMGQSGTATISVTPTNSFAQAVSFACMGLPSESACSFSPMTITPSGSAASTTMTITTTAASSRNSSSWPFAGGGITLAFGLIFLRRRKLPYRICLGLMIALLGVVCGVAIGCGGGKSSMSPPPNPGTPAGNSTVTITATAGSGANAISHTTTLSLTVR